MCYRYSNHLKTFAAAQKEMGAEESKSNFFVVTQPLEVLIALAEKVPKLLSPSLVVRHWVEFKPHR